VLEPENTGCGRKNSPIWEANENQTKQENFFLILNSIHNAVLKFKSYITQVAALIVDTLIESLLVLFHDPTGHFGRNGISFLGYRLLKTFQSLGIMLVYLGFEVAPEKKKLLGVRSGKRGGHTMLPHKETSCPGNICLRILSKG
jgi:hypothetical protein